jgi:hypothetical protein
VCSEGIDDWVRKHVEVEKGLGGAVFLRSTGRVRVDVTFRVRVVHVVVDRAHGVVVDLGVAGRTRSTVRVGHVVVDRARVRARSTVRVGHGIVDRARGVVINRVRGDRRRRVRSVEESERVLQRG